MTLRVTIFFPFPIDGRHRVMYVACKSLNLWVRSLVVKSIKGIILASLFFSSFSSAAGEFSKIDLVVREELARFFAIDFDSIWDLKILEGRQDCLLQVGAYVEKKSEWGEVTYETFSCVNRVSETPISSYSSEVIDFKRLSN